MLHGASFAPFDGLAGERLVNVLEINLTLEARYRTVHADGN